MRTDPNRKKGRRSRGRKRREPDEALDIRAVLDAIPDMVFKLTREGTVLAFQPGWAQMPSVPPGVFLGRRVHDVLPPDVADRIMYHVAAALETGRPQSFRFQLSVSGELRDREARMSPISRDAVLTFVRDVTVLVAAGGLPMATGAASPQRLYEFTARESQILALIAAGKTDKQVAEELRISPLTVHKHVANILAKMSVTSRLEAAVRAIREGLIA